MQNPPVPNKLPENPALANLVTYYLIIFSRLFLYQFFGRPFSFVINDRLSVRIAF